MMCQNQVLTWLLNIVDFVSRRSTVGMDGVGFTILLLGHNHGGDKGSASKI